MMMMGVVILGPSYIYWNKILVIHNNQFPESKLSKKRNFRCYHSVCESVAMGDSLTGNVGTNKNCADLATKLLYGGKHVLNLLYDIYDVFLEFRWKYQTGTVLVKLLDESQDLMSANIEGTVKMRSNLGSFSQGQF